MTLRFPSPNPTCPMSVIPIAEAVRVPQSDPVLGDVLDRRQSDGLIGFLRLIQLIDPNYRLRFFETQMLLRGICSCKSGFEPRRAMRDAAMSRFRESRR